MMTRPWTLTAGYNGPSPSSQGTCPKGWTKARTILSMRFPDLAYDVEPAVAQATVAGGSANDEVTLSHCRFLPHMTPAAFFDLYKRHGGIVGRSTFDPVFKAKWDNVGNMKIRRMQQHHPCNECIRIRFKAMRAEASTPTEPKDISAAYNTHSESMYADRMVDSRICKLSREATAECSGAARFPRRLNVRGRHGPEQVQNPARWTASEIEGGRGDVEIAYPPCRVCLRRGR